MLDNHIESEIFQSTIQKLTFTNCISLYKLYSLEYSEDFYNKYGKYPEHGAKDAEYLIYRRKYGGILKRLCVDEQCSSSAKVLVEKAKKYDKYMFESQIRLYNNTAEMARYSPIENSSVIQIIKNTELPPETQANYDVIAKYYPYYTDGKRDGVNFIECILLMNIFKALHKRSLYILNMEPKTDLNRNTIKKNINKIIASAKEEYMFERYVDIFFDIYVSKIDQMHRDIAEKSIRAAWLPEELKGLKDALSAFERYMKRLNKERPVEEKYEEIVENEPDVEIKPRIIYEKGKKYERAKEDEKGKKEDDEYIYIWELIKREGYKYICKKVKKNSDYEFYNEILEKNAIKSAETSDLLFDYATIDQLAGELLRRTFFKINGIEVQPPKYKHPEDIDFYDRLESYSDEYAQIIREYINKAIDEAINILNKVYIENLRT